MHTHPSCSCTLALTRISSQVSPSSLKRLSFADLSTTRLSLSLSESLSEPARNLWGGVSRSQESKQTSSMLATLWAEAAGDTLTAAAVAAAAQQHAVATARVARATTAAADDAATAVW